MPARGSVSQLSDVTRIPGSDDYWAVGSFTTNAGAIRSHIVRWTGSKWVVVPSPYVAGYRTRLRGVTALSASNAWAVGSYESFAPFSAFTFVLRWNGTSWNRVSSPSPVHQSSVSGLPFDRLNDALAVSPGNLWTVGDMTYQGADDDRATLVMHRQASAWQTLSLPQQSFEDTLESISALSPQDIWTVGWVLGPGGAANFTTLHLSLGRPGMVGGSLCRLRDTAS